MFTKQSISLLVLSALMALPTGIANAGDIDVQSDNVRVRVGQDSGIKIDSDDDSTETRVIRTPGTPTIIRTPNVRIYRPNTPNVRVYQPNTPSVRVERPNNIRRFGIWKYPGKHPVKVQPSVQCNGRNYSRTITQSSSSGSSTNRTYSSTTSCQK